MTLTVEDLDSAIRQQFELVIVMQNEPGDVPVLREDSVLLDAGLDSLGYAILVTRLEEELGYDPFTLSAEAYYPRTYGELLAFYHANQVR